MQVLVQRVDEATCFIREKVVGKISKGLLLYVSFHQTDTAELVPEMVKKITHLRIFNDDKDKLNLSIHHSSTPSILSISQFTLEASTHKGHRPSFTEALNPELAEHYFNHFNQLLKAEGIHVETGVFGEYMKIHSINDGPVTLLIKKTHNK